MGATLELGSVTATSWKEARNKVVERCEFYYGQDPYSGSFNTIIDWNECRKPFSAVDEFEEWVCEYGDKREAFVWTKDKETYYVCGWCAC